MLAWGLLLGLTPAAHAQLEVPLQVRDHAGVARSAWPVRGGVPLRRGVLQDCTQARLVDAGGAEVPCRVRPIARWYDGSVKWVLVDAQASTPANGETQLALTLGAAPKRAAQRVEVSETPEAVTVDTGPARFVFSRKAFGLPSEAWADLNGDGRWDTKVAGEGGEFVCEVEHQLPGEPEEENWLRDATGGERESFVARADSDYKVEVEAANDLHVVVRLSGWLTNASGRRLLQYIIRAHAYAGRSELGIVHTLVYAGKPKEDFIRTISLRFPRETGGETRWALGGESRHEGTLTQDASVSLWEVGPRKIYHLAPYTLDKTVYYTLDQGDRELATGKEAAGWAQLADTRASMTLAVRNFWQMHPKEIKLDPGAMTLYLWPEHGGKVLDLRRRYDYVENTYHYDLSLWEYGGEGVGLTHEMTLRFGPPQEDAGPGLSAALNAPLRLECSPEWYAESGAFGPFAVADPARYPQLEGVQNVILEWIRRNQRIFHWDGMIDYGDTMFHGYATPSHYGYVGENAWCSRGYVGWLCNDGTLTHSLFLQYLRTGDYEAFRTAEAMARHVMEVDTCHYCAEDPKYVGGGHRHDQQHWGNGVRGYGTATHGAIDYYLLTGDERALDVAKEYAQFHTDGNMGEDEDRIGGLIRIWEITGDPKWKQTADEVLAAELNVPADAGWRFVTAQHFRFVSNTSVSLLYYLYSAPPADTARLREAILKSMDFREAAFRSSWDEAGYLTLILTSLAYQESGDERYALTTACLAQRAAGFPRTLTPPADFLPALRGMDFETMVTTAQQWLVNNIYMANIHQLCSLPYAIAAFERAGLDEPAVYAVERTTNIPEPFEEVLDPKSISHEIGFAYTAGVQHGAPSDVAGGHSDLVLMENGKPLGPAHSAHADIRKDGQGRYSHWGARTLYFSTSDNTDPKTNGREYKVVYPGPQE
jgi:hypothetical protein